MKNYWGTFTGKELQMGKDIVAKEEQMAETLRKMQNFAHRQCKENGISEMVFTQLVCNDEAHPALWSKLSKAQQVFATDLVARYLAAMPDTAEMYS
jgi:hypothetical protein